jgi:hypothetical protein
LSDGLDVSRLVEMTTGRTLTLVDTLGDLIVRRFPVRHLGSEAEIDAFKNDLRAQYGLDDADTTLELRDSAPLRARRKARIQPGVSLPMPDAPAPDPA